MTVVVLAAMATAIVLSFSCSYTVYLVIAMVVIGNCILSCILDSCSCVICSCSCSCN